MVVKFLRLLKQNFKRKYLHIDFMHVQQVITKYLLVKYWICRQVTRHIHVEHRIKDPWTQDRGSKTEDPGQRTQVKVIAICDE